MEWKVSPDWNKRNGHGFIVTPADLVNIFSLRMQDLKYSLVFRGPYQSSIVRLGNDKNGKLPTGNSLVQDEIDPWCKIQITLWKGARNKFGADMAFTPLSSTRALTWIPNWGPSDWKSSGVFCVWSCLQLAPILCESQRTKNVNHDPITDNSLHQATYDKVGSDYTISLNKVKARVMLITPLHWCLTVSTLFRRISHFECQGDHNILDSVTYHQL